MLKENSTENRVNTMLKILFDSSTEKEKRHKASDNLVFLSRDEAGAERIFREGGPTALCELLDQPDPYVRLSALRTLSALCNGHQGRVNYPVKFISVEKLACLNFDNLFC